MHVATKFVWTFAIGFIAWVVAFGILIFMPEYRSAEDAEPSGFEKFLGLWLFLDLFGLVISIIAMIWTW